MAQIGYKFAIASHAAECATKQKHIRKSVFKKNKLINKQKTKKMKKFRAIALLGILLASSLQFSSCKKDEEPTQITEQGVSYDEFYFHISWTQKPDGTYKGRSNVLDQHLRPTDSYRNLRFTTDHNYYNASGAIPGRMYYYGEPHRGNYGWNFDYEIDNGSVVFEATCFGEAQNTTYGSTTYGAPQEWPQRPSSNIKFQVCISR